VNVAALEASRLALAESLKSPGGAAAGGRRQSRMRDSLVVAEVALAVMLLVGAGLLVRTFVQLRQVDLGFKPDNVLSFDVSLSESKYPAPLQAARFFDQTLDRLRAIGGVSEVGASEYLPLSGADSATPFFVDGRPRPAPGEDQKAHYRSVTPDYFRAMGISLVRGRLLTDRDGANGPRVALVNETMARQYWRGENPIGQRVAITLEALRFRPDGPPTLDIAPAMREIVGIVADVRHGGLRAELMPEVHMPFAQRPTRSMAVVMRTTTDPLAVARDARRIVTAIDPDQPIADVNTVSALVSASIAQPRFNVLLLSAFAAVAVLLAVVGVYGVMSYSVARDRRPHRARRPGARHRRADRPPGDARRLDRVGDRAGERPRARPCHVGPAIWCEGHRSGNVRRGRDRARYGRAGGLLSAGAPRDAHRSGDGPAHRVGAS
jgi:putative ABC transport system permease protein